jgi:hypothetical protein
MARWGSAGGGGAASYSGTLTPSETVAAAATLLVDGSLTATNVTINGSCTIDPYWPSDRDSQTLIRVIQGGGGGFTPTFAGVTWLTAQPPWTTQSGGHVEEVRLYTVEGDQYAEWVGMAASLNRSAYGQNFPANKWVTPDYAARTTATGTREALRACRWHSWDAPVTFDDWSFEITTGATTTAGQEITVRCGIYAASASDPYLPGNLIGEFTAHTIAVGTISAAVINVANSVEITVPAGVDFYVATVLQGVVGAFGTVQYRFQNPSTQRLTAASPGELFGGALQSVWQRTGVSGALPSPFDTTPVVAANGMIAIALHVKA